MLKTAVSLAILVSCLTISVESRASSETSCTAKIVKAVSSEDAPALVEACFDVETREAVNACTDSECVREVVQ